MTRTLPRDRFGIASIAGGLLLLGFGSAFLIFEPWWLFLPMAVWLGWLQVGSL
jgi:hypothetical protein